MIRKGKTEKEKEKEVEHRKDNENSAELTSTSHFLHRAYLSWPYTL